MLPTNRSHHRSTWRLSLVVAAVFFFSTSLHASGFSLLGSYWDTDALGDTAGGQLVFAIPVTGHLDIDLRAAYYEKLESDGFDEFLDDAFDLDRDVFVDNSVEVIPAEVGAKWNFLPGETFNFYAGGGAGYYLLDHDRFSVDDEFGFYGVAGITLGDPRGFAFNAEVVYRKIEGTIEGDLGDPDDFGLDDRVDLDLDGIAANAGFIYRW